MGTSTTPFLRVSKSDDLEVIFSECRRCGLILCHAYDDAGTFHRHCRIASHLDVRTELSDDGIVKGSEFERRVRRLARRMRVACEFVAAEGKGSHGRLYFGEEFTTLKDRRKEIGRDLFAKMCRDLKIDPHEL
jgi:mRNA interferase HicA